VSAVVRVAAIYSVGLGPMNEYVQQFMAERPGTRVQVEYLHPDRVYERVLEETADLGIVSFPQSRRDLSVLPWRQEAMVAVCPPGHRLAKARAVAAAELQGETFVGFDRGLVIRRQVDRFLKRHGVEVHIAIEFDNVEAIKRAVEVGSGISILPKPTLERETALGSLRAVPFTGPRFVRPLGIIRRRGKRPAPSVEQFVQLLLQVEGLAKRPARPGIATRRRPPPAGRR
jgi:DNA-binding transcriptional LysR family regulator